MTQRQVFEVPFKLSQNWKRRNVQKSSIPEVYQIFGVRVARSVVNRSIDELAMQHLVLRCQKRTA